MLLNKAQLTAHERCAQERGRYALNGMLLEPDGTTVAADGAALIAVEGLNGNEPEYPLEHVTPAAPVIIPAALVKEALKNMPKSGMPHHREHVALTHCDGHVEFATTDGEKTRRVDMPPVEGQFPNYPEIVPDPAKTAPLARIRFNPKLLADVLVTVHKAASPGRGNIRSVELEIYEGTGPAIIRTETDEGQHILALVSPVVIENDDGTRDGGGPSRWERSLKYAPALRREVAWLVRMADTHETRGHRRAATRCERQGARRVGGRHDCEVIDELCRSALDCIVRGEDLSPLAQRLDYLVQTVSDHHTTRLEGIREELTRLYICGSH